LVVTNTVNGCTSSAVISIPDYLAEAGQDLAFCNGDNVQLNANLPASINNVFGSWTAAQTDIDFAAADDPNTFVSNLTLPDGFTIIPSNDGLVQIEAPEQSVRFDGTNGSGKDLPEGTYYYLAKLSIGEGEFRYGSVTIRKE